MGQVVWFSKEMRSTTALYMIVISLYDLGHIIASFLSDGRAGYTYFTGSKDGITDGFSWYWDIFMPGQHYILCVKGILGDALTWTVIAMTFDRVVGVWLPLKHSSICTKRRVQVAIMCAHAMGWCISGVRLGERKLERRYMQILDLYFWLSRETDLWKSESYQKVFLSIIYPALSLIIPVITLIVANSVIIYGLVKMARKSKEMASGGGTGGQNRDSAALKISYQALCMSLLTLFFRSGNVYEHIVVTYTGTNKMSELPLEYALSIILWRQSFAFSSLLNFFVFCYFGNKFRQAFLKKYGLTRCVKRTKK